MGPRGISLGERGRGRSEGVSVMWERGRTGCRMGGMEGDRG